MYEAKSKIPSVHYDDGPEYPLTGYHTDIRFVFFAGMSIHYNAKTT